MLEAHVEFRLNAARRSQSLDVSSSDAKGKEGVEAGG